MKLKSDRQLRCGVRMHGCYESLPASQMLRLVWKKANKQVDACPTCFQAIREWEIKNAEIKLEDLVKSGLYDKGVRSVDIKQILTKWNKEQLEKL